MKVRTAQIISRKYTSTAKAMVEMSACDCGNELFMVCTFHNDGTPCAEKIHLICPSCGEVWCRHEEGK